MSKSQAPRYTVKFTSSARREFNKLPSLVRNKVVEALWFLALNPYTELLQIKKLKGPEKLLRVRIGDYRIVYQIEAQVLLVVVVKIGHRREVYR